MADPAAISRSFAALRSDFGDPEVLIYNAGSGVWKAVAEVSAAEFELSWRVNALGALVASQQVLPAMRKNGRGNIVFVGCDCVATRQWFWDVRTHDPYRRRRQFAPVRP